MLSIEKAREILGKSAQELTDDQVQNLLNIIYFVLKKTRDKGLDKPINKYQKDRFLLQNLPKSVYSDRDKE